MPLPVLRTAVLVLVTITGSGVLGAEPRGIDELLNALEDPDPHARFMACRELQDLGLDAAPAVPRLIQLLAAHDDGARVAADTLGAVGKDATAAIPKLIEQLGEGELPRISTELPVTDVGVHAAFALGKMGPDAVPLLIPCLADERSAVRSNAARLIDHRPRCEERCDVLGRTTARPRLAGASVRGRGAWKDPVGAATSHSGAHRKPERQEF